MTWSKSRLAFYVEGLVILPAEVMYSHLTADPPQKYAPGDRQGLLILATERGV